MTDQNYATLLVREPGESRDALPVRLPPWVENPYGLVSLHTMLQVYVDRYIEIGRILQEWMYGPMVLAAPAQRLTGQPLEDWKAALVTVRLHSAELGLRVTEQLFTDTIARMEGMQPTRQVAARVLEDIHRCFIAELKAQVFFFIPNHRVKYYADVRKPTDLSAPPEVVTSAPPLFGEQVANSFPSASYDIKEAGNCYAVGRNTACVFHLMRALESGLSVLAAQFKISSDRANWDTIINQTEKAIADLDKGTNRPAKWKDDREFYSQCASHFRVLKDAWRNYTAHARGKYDEGEAEPILRNVGDFMRRLATRLHE